MNKTMIRSISFLLTLFLILGMMPIKKLGAPVTLAADEIDGNGFFLAPVNPNDDLSGYIRITNIAGLEGIRNDLNGKYYLAGNIDFNQWMNYDLLDWTPIGTQDNPFTGVLDGRGYSISGLQIDGRGPLGLAGTPAVAGFFGFAHNATIRNLGMERVSIDNSKASAIYSYAGGLIGSLMCGGSNSLTISNCYVSGSITSKQIAGGFIGYGHHYHYTQEESAGLLELSVADCANLAKINTINGDAGGIIGYSSAPSNLRFSRCVNYRDISGGNTGGIIGSSYNYLMNSIQAYNSSDIFYHNSWNCNIDLLQCENNGNLFGNTNGGMIGILYCEYDLVAKSNVSLMNNISVCVKGCRNTGKIEGTHSGGMIGDIFIQTDHFTPNWPIVYQAGESDLNDLAIDVSIADCYNIGFIISNSSVASIGGMVGFAYIDARGNSPPGKSVSELTVENCINDGYVLGSYIAGGLIGYAHVYSYDYEVPKALPIESILTVLGCRNNADIIVYGKGLNTDGAGPVSAGGIIGFLLHMASDDTGAAVGSCETTIENCINNGTIIANHATVGTPLAGGIVADIVNAIDTFNGIGAASGSVYSHIIMENCTSIDEVYGVANGLFGQSDAYITTGAYTGDYTEYDPANYSGIGIKTIINGEDITGRRVHGTLRSGTRLLHTESFHGNRAVVVPVSWDEASFFSSSNPPTGYNKDLAFACSVLSTAAYNGTCDIHNNTTNGHFIEETYRSLGFTEEKIKLFSYPGHPKNQTEYEAVNTSEDKHAFAIADKTISVDGDSYHLIVITLRGTGGELFRIPPSPDWRSNIIGALDSLPFLDTRGHAGFVDFYRKIRTALNQYIEINNLKDANKNKILITGHSLGGAAASLLTADLSNSEDIAKKNNIYCYTFGSPNPVMLTGTKTKMFDNIFNIVNRRDPVTGVVSLIITETHTGSNHVVSSSALAWKYGRTLALPSESEVTPDYKQYKQKSLFEFAKLLGYSTTDLFSIEAVVEGLLFGLGNHYPPYYIAWMKSEPPLYEEMGPGNYSKLVTIKCPVDVAVFDSADLLVGLIADNSVDESIESNLILFIDGDTKSIVLPEGKYRFSLIGTDDGEMVFSVVDLVDYEDDNTLVCKEFIDVKLFAGKKMSSAIGGDISTPGIRLFILDEQGKPVAEVLENGSEVTVSDILYSISLSESGTHTFATQMVGYNPISAQTVTVTNTGNQATGALIIALSGANPGSFTLSTASIASLAVSGSDSFIVKPNDALATGTYTATVTVSGGNGIIALFGISFTVNPLSTPTAYAFTHSAGTGGSISGTVNGNYEAGTPISVTANANSNYQFTGWAISGATITGGNTANPATFIMPPNAVALTASFTYSGGSNGGYAGGTTTPTTPPTIPTSSDEGGKTTDIDGGNTVITPLGQDPVDNGDGFMALPGGGTVNTKSKDGGKSIVRIDVPPGTVIGSDGSISFPKGSGGGTITYANSYTFDIPEDAVIILDEDAPLGYFISLDSPFVDVKESDWFYISVMFAYAHRFMIGTSIAYMN